MAGRLLAISLLLCACDPTYLDEGFHVTDDGVELHPGAMPVTVYAEDDCADVAGDAIAWWAGQLDAEVFASCNGDCDVTVALGLVPATGDIDAEGEPMGHATIGYSA